MVWFGMKEERIQFFIGEIFSYKEEERMMLSYFTYDDGFTVAAEGVGHRGT